MAGPKPKKKKSTESVTTDPNGRKTYMVKGKAVGSSATTTYGKGTKAVKKK